MRRVGPAAFGAAMVTLFVVAGGPGAIAGKGDPQTCRNNPNCFAVETTRLTVTVGGTTTVTETVTKTDATTVTTTTALETVTQPTSTETVASTVYVPSTQTSLVTVVSPTVTTILSTSTATVTNTRVTAYSPISRICDGGPCLP